LLLLAPELGDELLLPAAAGVARDMGGARSGGDL
jgi:hypothetical protein